MIVKVRVCAGGGGRVIVKVRGVQGGGGGCRREAGGG